MKRTSRYKGMVSTDQFRIHPAGRFRSNSPVISGRVAQNDPGVTHIAITIEPINSGLAEFVLWIALTLWILIMGIVLVAATQEHNGWMRYLFGPVVLLVAMPLTYISVRLNFQGKAAMAQSFLTDLLVANVS